MAKAKRPAPPRNHSKKAAPAAAAAEKKAPSKPVPDTPEDLLKYKESLGKKIRVRATATGFIDNVRRRAGDVFDVREGEVSERWMERVDGSTPVKATGAQMAMKANHDTVMAERHGGAPATATTGPRSSGDRDVLGG